MKDIIDWVLKKVIASIMARKQATKRDFDISSDAPGNK